MSRNSFLAIFIVCLCGTMIFANDGNSQSSRLHEVYINIEEETTSLKKVFETIERQTGFEFSYFKSVLKNDKLNLQLSAQENLGILLNKISEASKLSFKRVNDKIYISKHSKDTEPTVEEINVRDVDITGKITDENGEGLPGASVVVKGTSQGTTTDIEGNYKLVAPDEAILTISFVGYITQEVAVGGRSTIDTQLVLDAAQLDEVVVIGYGTQKKKDLTGSVMRMDMKDKNMSTNVNITQALQGQAPGLNVGISGKAGGSPNISVRGQTSLSATDEPLIVLDGIIFNGNITDININDVESIDILKDASAAAVYGSRSANGVIIITTKTGKRDKTEISFNTYYGFQDISPTKRINVMNGEEYAIRMVDYAYQQELYNGFYTSGATDASGRPERPDVTNRNEVATYLRSLEEQENYMAGNEIDWLDEVTRTAPIQEYSIGVSGSTDRTTYYISGSYTDQQGVAVNDQFDRASIRMNMKNDITDWLSIGLNTYYAHLDYSGLEANIGHALRASPWANKFDELGNYPIDLAGESIQQHPFANTIADDKEVEDNIFTVFSATVDVPKIKGLVYEFNFSNTFNTRKHNSFYYSNTALARSSNGKAIKEHNERRSLLINNILRFNRILAEKHNVGITLLYTYDEVNDESSVLTAEQFQNESLGYNAMHLGAVQTNQSGFSEESSIGYMARLNYSYDDKYLFTGTFRRDGYSGFSSNNKWGNFYSLSAGWVISEEDFLGAEWVDQLKFRLSYGINGNQGIGRYQSLSGIATTEYVFGSTTAIGTFPEQLGNNNLSWEQTASLNLGIDFGLFENRLTGSVNVYDAETTDVLVVRSAPGASGYESVLDNVGVITNKGIEFSLNTVNLRTSALEWSSGIILSINRNKLIELYQGVAEDIGNEWFVGHPIGAEYDYVVDGVWTEGELFTDNITDRYYPGHMKLLDLNENGNIHANDDRTVIGYAEPNYRFGVSNTLSYKNFKLSAFINSIQGGNGYYIEDSYDNVVAGGTDTAQRVNRTTTRSYWRPDAAVGNAPSMYYSPRRAHGLYEDKSFVRLQDITFSYTFNQDILDKLRLSSLRVYLSGKNLYTWTNWSGWDPEGIDEGNPNNYSDEFNYASNRVPIMRSFIAGINLTF